DQPGGVQTGFSQQTQVLAGGSSSSLYQEAQGNQSLSVGRVLPVATSTAGAAGLVLPPSAAPAISLVLDAQAPTLLSYSLEQSSHDSSRSERQGEQHWQVSSAGQGYPGLDSFVSHHDSSSSMRQYQEAGEVDGQPAITSFTLSQHSGEHASLTRDSQA